MGPGGIIARTQRARYNAALSKPAARKGRTLKRSWICSATRTLLFASLALSVSLAAAQSYPSRPIRLLLPFAGGTDAVARLLAFKMSPALGRAGAARAAPRRGREHRAPGGGGSRARRLYAAHGGAAPRDQSASESHGRLRR